MLLLCTPKFTQTSIDVDKKCLYSFEYQPASTNCQTPSIRRVNAKNIAWCIAQKNAVQSLVPTCAFWLSTHMVANYMAWSLKIPHKLVDAYIYLALNQSERQGCSISVELQKKLGGSFSQPPPFSSAMQNFGEIQDQDELVNQLDESSGQVAQTSLGTRPLFEDKPTSKVQIVCAASYVLESLLVQELILARSTSD